jgi:hypothetical protein
MKMVYNVYDFVEGTGGVTIGHPTPQASKDLYERLIHEEYKEFCSSTTDENKLNECLDLIWVIIGYMITRGWNIPAAWQALYMANMSKLVFDEEGRLKRRADGKIQKPDNWQKADFSPFLTPKEVNHE